MKSRPILIAGPTASGKSALALALAKRAPSVILNADALQVYSNWSVLTARPPAEDEAQVPHQLYGHVDPNHDYSVGHWLREVGQALADANQNDLRPIIVGGTGLYFSALTKGLAEIPATPPEVRQEGDAMRDQHGVAGFLEYLTQHDPDILTRTDQQNPMRLQRAWEVHRATGKALSTWQADTPPPLLDKEACQCLVMRPDVDWLNARIAKRFDQMIEGGALDEVRANIAAGLDFARPAGQALGAAELRAHLQEGLPLVEAATQSSIATRQYAKRQRTWFRNRMKDWQDLVLDDSTTIASMLALIAP